MFGKRYLSAAMLTLALMGSAAIVVAGTATEAVAAAKPISAKVGKPLQEGQELLNKGKAKEALAKFKEAESVSGKTAYETTVVNQLMAAAYQKLGDYGNAAKALEAALATGELDPPTTVTFQKAAAQMYYQVGNKSKALEFGNKYLKSSPNDTDIAALMAQITYDQRDYAGAATQLRELIAGAERSGKAVPESYLKLLLNAEHNRGNADGYISALEKTLKLYPKPDYWRDALVRVLQKPGITDLQKLDTYRLMFKVGALDGGDYVKMGERALAVRYPGDAKRALDKGAAVGAITSDRDKKLQARANADAAAELKLLPTIEGQAASQATGVALASIGQAYLGHAKYDKAISLLSQALAKGGLEDPQGVKLRLGMAYAGAGSSDKARSTLNGVGGSGATKDLARLCLISL